VNRVLKNNYIVHEKSLIFTWSTKLIKSKNCNLVTVILAHEISTYKFTLKLYST